MKNETKNYRDFFNQYKKEKSPFREFILRNKTLRNNLFYEFIDTEQKPNLDLFLSQYYSEKEIEEGIIDNTMIGHTKSINAGGAVFTEDTDFIKGYRRKCENFYNQVFNKNLESKFYSHQIKETKTVKTLYDIEEKSDNLLEWVISEERSISEKEERAKRFISLLESKLHNLENVNLKIEVVNNILRDNKNVLASILTWKKNFNGSEIYQEFRDYYLDFHLNQLLKNLQEEKIRLDKINASTNTIKQASSNIYADNDLDFYINSWLNATDRTFVFNTIQYFKKGSRKNLFNPTQFLNLLYKQLDFFDHNPAKPYSTVLKLKQLPLTREEKHILFGFILKWYGGYPFEVNSQIPLTASLKLIQDEFVSYELDTPEKIYCLKESLNGFPPILPKIETAISYKFTQKDFVNFISNYDWDYFYSGESIRNIKLIFDTVEYFEYGGRGGFIEPLTALNLIYTNYKFLKENNITPIKNIEKFKNLPFDEEVKHTLFGMIIFWFGGSTNNIDWGGTKYQENLKLIEEVFLDFNETTPEKILLGYIKKSEKNHSLAHLNNKINKDSAQIISHSTNKLENIQSDYKSFCEYFENPSAYKYIMDLLVEKRHCQSGTFIWIDEEKGNKGLLVAIIKFLHAQKYYKHSKRPTLEQIRDICLNTFGKDISMDTIKRTKTKDFVLEFIPIASTLE